MKQLSSLLLLLLLTVSATAQKVDSDFLPFSDKVDYKVIRYTSNRLSDWGGTAYAAQKGEKFKSAWIEFKNTTNEDQIINFGKVGAVDSKNREYKAHIVAKSFKTMTEGNFDYELQAGKTVLFIVEFWPPMPKDEVATVVITKNGSEFKKFEK